MAVWVMMYTQLYFMKTRNEEIEYRVKFYSLHLIFIVVAYTLQSVNSFYQKLACYYMYLGTNIFFSHWRLCILLMNLHYLTQVVGKLAKMCEYADNKSAFNTL